MKRAIPFLVLAVLGAAAAIGLLAWDAPLTSRRNPETEDAYADGEVINIAPHVSGYLSSLPVTDNQAVRAGDVIATVDDADYRAQLEQAQAQLDSAMAAERSTAERERTSVLQITEAETNVRATDADLLRDRQEAGRQHLLLPTEVGLLRSAQMADASLARTEASRKAAVATVEQRRQAASVAQAQHVSAVANVELARAQLALAQLQLGWTVIRAPADGTLGTRTVRVGQLVEPGATIDTLTNLATVWISASFNERQITDVLPGQPARVRPDAWPGTEIGAHVVDLSPATGATLSLIPGANTTGNYTRVVQRVTVKLALDAADNPLAGRLRPGMSVLARVLTRSDSRPGVRELR